MVAGEIEKTLIFSVENIRNRTFVETEICRQSDLRRLRAAPLIKIICIKDGRNNAMYFEQEKKDESSRLL
jgi:hypothetical protein